MSQEELEQIAKEEKEQNFSEKLSFFQVCVIEYNGGGHYGFDDTNEEQILQIKHNDYLKLC